MSNVMIFKIFCVSDLVVLEFRFLYLDLRLYKIRKMGFFLLIEMESVRNGMN